MSRCLCSKSTRYRLVYFQSQGACKDRLVPGDDDIPYGLVPNDESRLVILDSTGDGSRRFRNCGLTDWCRGFDEVTDFRYGSSDTEKVALSPRLRTSSRERSRNLL
jgi:hypothetical protein